MQVIVFHALGSTFSAAVAVLVQVYWIGIVIYIVVNVFIIYHYNLFLLLPAPRCCLFVSLKQTITEQPGTCYHDDHANRDATRLNCVGGQGLGQQTKYIAHGAKKYR